jgi:hypothetical protein
MDSVLTRKMFRDRYFQYHKPKQFNKGGIANIQHFVEGGLSRREKAIIAATFASPLLTSTQRQGESKLTGVSRALGEGFAKLPDTLISIEKARPEGVTESVRQATDAEKIQLGYSADDNINVKVKNGVIQSIVSKPTAGERDKAADRVAAFDSLDRIEAGLKKVKTGPVSGRLAKTRAFLGMDKDAALLNTEIEDFRKSIIKALRGAQVGVAEEASFEAVLPSINDPAQVIAAKIEVARNKLGNIEKRLNPNGTVATRLEAEEIAKQDQALFQKFGLAFNLDPNFDPNVSTFNPDGTPVR